VGECGLDKAVLKDFDYIQQESIVLSHLRLATKYRRPLTLHCVSGAWARLLTLLTSEAHLHFGPQIPKVPQNGPKVPKRVPIMGAAVGTASLPYSTILHSCNTLPIDMLPDFLSIPGVYFSFAGRTLNHKTLKLIAAVPRDRLLIETDAPDQLPSHLRQSRRSLSASPSPSPSPSADVGVGVGVGVGAGVGAGTSAGVGGSAQYNEPALLRLHCIALAEALHMDPSELAALTRANALCAFNLA
jgi:Tat protein secretion system quality control protein TatD with DNase activity